MRRTLILVTVALLALLGAPRAEAALTKITIGLDGKPSPNPADVPTGDDVYWHNSDPVTAHTIYFDGRDPVVAPAGGDSNSITVDVDAGSDIQYRIDDPSKGTIYSIHAVEPPTTTATPSSSTTTTTRPTTTSSTTTTSTSSTTTTSSSTTTTTTFPSSSFGGVAIAQPNSGGGGSSAVPLLVGALVLVAALAGGAYWLWSRSGQQYVDEGPDWTQEPPPTTQGPLI